MTDAKTNGDGQAANGQDGRQLALQKIYLRDLSFESPFAPAAFREQQESQIQLNIQTASRTVGDDSYEVVLTLNVEAKAGEQTIFLVELQQAGLFLARGYDEQQLHAILGSYCPGLLYPYAREAISDLVGKGGFPQLLLQPINFDALYAQRSEGSAEPGAEAAGEAGEAAKSDTP